MADVASGPTSTVAPFPAAPENGIKLGSSLALASEPPPPPSPSADPVSNLPIKTDLDELAMLVAGRANSPEIDIFRLSPVAMLKLMCASIVDLVQVSGEIPPTPPPSHPMSPDLRTNGQDGDGWIPCSNANANDDCRPQTPVKHIASDEIDGVALKGTPIGSPESTESESYNIIGANAESNRVQHDTIVRKFYSKRPPPIPLEEYVLRIHRYCPMSTAVFLAASLYIHRLATAKRPLHITSRNIHRLLLATLRIAVKALEDRSYPHRRFAKVGGVSEAELKRLEISFCFVINFDLKVNEEMLLVEAIKLRAAQKRRLAGGFVPVFPSESGLQL